MLWLRSPSIRCSSPSSWPLSSPGAGGGFTGLISGLFGFSVPIPVLNAIYLKDGMVSSSQADACGS